MELPRLALVVDLSSSGCGTFPPQMLVGPPLPSSGQRASYVDLLRKILLAADVAKATTARGASGKMKDFVKSTSIAPVNPVKLVLECEDYFAK